VIYKLGKCVLTYQPIIDCPFIDYYTNQVTIISNNFLRFIRINQNPKHNKRLNITYIQLFLNRYKNN